MDAGALERLSVTAPGFSRSALSVMGKSAPCEPDWLSKIDHTQNSIRALRVETRRYPAMAAAVESCKRKKWTADDPGVAATLLLGAALLFFDSAAGRLKNEVGEGITSPERC
jgi:hypothetical protein